jgi:hypothetical protein
MWLAGTARPHMTDLDEIEKLLNLTSAFSKLDADFMRVRGRVQ